jgi:hypothetical protein
MRSIRILPLIALLAAMMILTLSPTPQRASVWAQLGAPPAPLPPPPQPPGAAPTAGAVTAPAAARLAPAPGATAGALQATAAPTPRVFYCSCFGTASPTRWMGQVQAQNYFAARQAAVNSCLAYNFNRRPSSAYVPPSVFHFFPTPAPPSTGGQTQPGLPSLQAPGLSGFALLSSPRAAVLRLCSQCSCD